MIDGSQEISSPFVELVRSSDSFVLPQVRCVQAHCLWVSSSQSFSYPSIMKSLSITEFQISSTKSKRVSEHPSHESLVKVNIKVIWSCGSWSLEIWESNKSSEKSETDRFSSSNNFVMIINVPEVKIKRLWVMLD